MPDEVIIYKLEVISNTLISIFALLILNYVVDNYSLSESIVYFVKSKGYIIPIVIYFSLNIKSIIKFFIMFGG